MMMPKQSPGTPPAMTARIIKDMLRTMDTVEIARVANWKPELFPGLQRRDGDPVRESDVWNALRRGEIRVVK